MMRRHRRCFLLIVFFGCCVTSLFLGRTGVVHAYYKDEQMQINETRIGTVEAKLQEDFETPEEIIPGIKIKKRIWVENTGSAPCYVRVRVTFSDSRMEKLCNVDWNQNDWIQNGEEPYFYYRNILYPGKTTTDLMQSVTVLEDASSEMLEPFQILVYTEACQVGNAEDWKEAWEYFFRNH